MKMKKFWARGGGARPSRPPLDPPLIRVETYSHRKTPAQADQKLNPKRHDFNKYFRTKLLKRLKSIEVNSMKNACF